MNDSINTLNLKIGDKFTSIYYKGITEIINVNEKNNTLDVIIRRSEEHSHEENDWNLQHTIWAFERGDYQFVEEKINVDSLLNKHGQLEDEGAYAD